MTQKIPALQIKPAFNCFIFYDCHQDAGKWIDDNTKSPFPEWDQLNDLVYDAAMKAGGTDKGSINQYHGGAACFPYIEITAPTWALCKAMGDAVIRCILDNGGTVDPKDNGINI